ncbi:hypothetical protein JW905_13845 [bacterium]|nr:hypothetical protein [candidate division CSSED10-310 bacterium]
MTCSTGNLDSSSQGLPDQHVALLEKRIAELEAQNKRLLRRLASYAEEVAQLHEVCSRQQKLQVRAAAEIDDESIDEDKWEELRIARLWEDESQFIHGVFETESDLVDC